MTARISLILGKTGAHRAPLQLRLFNFFTASMTAATVDSPKSKGPLTSNIACASVRNVISGGHMHLANRAAIAGPLLLLAAMLVSIPAFAQIDFSGEWAPRFYEDEPERVPGPELGDYLGLPLNEAARMRADTWSASVQTLPEWQCRPHSADYIWRGPSPLRIWKDVDPVTRQITAFHAEWLRSVDRTVYLDGRPHPPEYAAHTWAGFSTAKWEGDMLTVTGTHLKEGYVRRNGVPRSDMATLTEHWIPHGNWLTVVEIVNDPVYLMEPFIRTTDYELDLHQQI